VVSQTQMQDLEHEHNVKVKSLQERLNTLQTRLETLQKDKVQWMQELGWKSETPILEDKKSPWMRLPGQGGPLRLLTLPAWTRSPENLVTTEETLERTEQTVALIGQSWQSEQEKMALLPVSSPLKGDFGMTSRFGGRADPLTHDRAFHEGLDLIASWQAPVIATAPGRVLRSEYSGAYGQWVEIEHAHHYISRYAHLDRRLVAVGDVVRRGQTLGMLGNSGRSTGPHLHYEVLYKNRPINPETPLQALWADRK
jgi:murein DD-endopeptidase MepM/ murein hydrolase activator NlpD